MKPRLVKTKRLKAGLLAKYVSNKMGRTRANLVGQKFNKLLVIKDTGKIDSSNSSILKCRCDCPKETITLVPARHLKSGHTKSCGCLSYKHGASQSPFMKGSNQLDYVIWCQMKQRCKDKNHISYKYYGKNNITVCKEWVKDFILFSKYIRTLENCPSEDVLCSRLKGKRIKMSIDRIDNCGNYEPGNIKWSTSKEQNNNRRSNKIVIYKGQEMSFSEMCDKYAVVKYHIVYQRIYRDGWSIEDALKTPSRR